MKLLKRALGVGVAVGSTAALLLTATPAHAAPFPSGNIITAAGSDTTEAFDTSLLNNAANGTYNIPAQPATQFTVPGDSQCGTINYIKSPAGAGQTVAPNGSGQGITSVAGTFAGVALNCVDIGRSSRDYLTSDPAGLEFNAFAMDAVSWASPSLSAPAVLDNAALQGIFTCLVTDWSQLPGGGSGPIQRFMPQASSGTGKTFIKKVMGGVDPHTISTSTCPAVIDIEENHGNDAKITPALYQRAIMPYSAAKWAFQANNSKNPSLDIRNGARIGLVNTGTLENAMNYSTSSGTWGLNATLVNETNAQPPVAPTTDGIGVRFVYHVLNPTTGNPSSVTDARTLVSTGSPLCSGGQSSLIRSQGFQPIPNVGGTTCRIITTQVAP